MIPRRTLLLLGCVGVRLLPAIAAPAPPLGLHIVRGPLPPVAYTAGAAVFDGLDDHMRLTSSGPAGLADGPAVTASFWLNMAAAGDAVTQRVFVISTSTPAERLSIRRNGSNLIQIRGANASGAPVLDVSTAATLVSADGWVHVYIAMDLTDPGRRRIYLNGVSQTLTVAAYDTSGVMDLVAGANGRFTVGADHQNTPGIRLNAAIADFWFDDVYLDAPAMFFEGGNPVDPGALGTGAVFFLHGSGDDFDLNSGTGGDFTITGTLTTTTPP